MATTASTWGIAPPVRSVLRSRILELRNALEEDADRQLAAVGVGADRSGDVPAGRTLTVEEERLREVASTVIARAMEAGDDYPTARSAFITEAAYTLLDRAVAFRCLEERGQLLIDGQPETLIRRDAGGSASLLWQIREAQPDLSARQLARAGYRRACQAMSERIKVLFDPDAEHAAFFPLQATWERLVAALNAPEVPPATYAEDEVVGWVYQYWNSAEKDRVYAKLGKGGKIETPGELSAASCLYTERYIVDYLIQNTLGALWTEMHPDSRLPESWPYFVRRPEGNPPVEREPKRVRDIRLLDPACGSGHFLVRAFELFRQLYAEEGLEDPSEIPTLILEHNLYGIDIDRRAIQIAALALYLKGCEVAGPEFRPRKLNLVAADLDLPTRPPAAFLERFADQSELAELAKSLWSGLAGVQTFGSLLHPEREISQTFDRIRKQQRGTLWQTDAGEWAKRRRKLLAGLREAIHVEAESPNLGRHLFGTHAGRALDLVQILSLRYDVCVANPPYAGRKNLASAVRNFVERDFAVARQDLYTAFIVRCSEFARAGGLVGMVTQQGWMFGRTFAELRLWILRNFTVATLAQLGPGAFEEIGGAVVTTAAFTFRTTPPNNTSHFAGVRAVRGEGAAAKAAILRGESASILRHDIGQARVLEIPDSPFVFWVSEGILNLLASPRTLGTISEVRQGLATADDERFLRSFWETRLRSDGWVPFAKGGRYQKWAGLNWLEIDWVDDGARMRATGRAVFRNPSFYFKPGLTYTKAASGSLGMRVFADGIFGHAANLMPVPRAEAGRYAGLLCARPASFLLRLLSQGIDFSNAYVSKLPLPGLVPDSGAGNAAIELKSRLVDADPVERTYRSDVRLPAEPLQALLHAIEGWNERLVFDAYELGPEDVQAVLDETGYPPGWQPLVAGYDALPHAPDGIGIPARLSEFLDTLEHRELSGAELATLKKRVRAAYEAGPGAKLDDEESAKGGDEDGAALGARIPIPTETFIEELADKLAIHPISIYWLLEELKAEGVVSPPLRKTELTDYVSVSLLRMLGYRWPEQDAYEATHPPILDPDLVDLDGIIPLVPCANQPTAADRLMTRLERQFGEDGAAGFVADFRRYVGRELDAWLSRDFFKAHARQFKNRPIAWHLRSPEGHFSALVLYHRLSRDTLVKLRSQYAGDRIATLRNEQDRARSRGETTRVSELVAAIEDVEAFRQTIEAIERGDTLTDRIRCRWKDEKASGRPGPYAPDIDDGVKVNIRPFQENGLLPAQVISKW